MDEGSYILGIGVIQTKLRRPRSLNNVEHRNHGNMFASLPDIRKEMATADFSSVLTLYKGQMKEELAEKQKAEILDKKDSFTK